MKKFCWTLLLLPLLLMTAASGQPPTRRVANQTFTTGEHLAYRVHYGFVDGGEATIGVGNKVHMINDRPCYKIEVEGRTTGAVRMLYKVRDVWGSYVDTAAFLPHVAYRNIQENNYRKEETTYFDQAHRQARIVDERRQEEKTMDTDHQVLDLVSGAFYLRLQPFGRMKEGDTFRMKGLFEDEIYDMKIRYLGKEKIRTRFGKIQTLRLQPILPDNGLFDGENAIDIYLSDDANKVPVKIRANMVVGALEIDLKGYRGLKHESSFEK